MTRRAKRPCELRKLGVITITGPLTNTPAPNYCVSCDPTNYYGNGRPSSGPAPPTPRPPDQVGKYAAEQGKGLSAKHKYTGTQICKYTKTLQHKYTSRKYTGNAIVRVEGSPQATCTSVKRTHGSSQRVKANKEPWEKQMPA